MTPERIAEIYDSIHNPAFRVNLSEQPSVMGPRYVSETIAKILRIRQEISDLCEEVDLQLTKELNLEADLQEEWDLRTEFALTHLEEDEVEGFDAKARLALAHSKVQKAYEEDLKKLGEYKEESPPVLLRTQLKQVGQKVRDLKTLLRVLEGRRKDLEKLDSGVRLQQQTIKTETDLVTHGLPVVTGSNGTKKKSPTIPAENSPEFSALIGDSGEQQSENELL